MDRLLSIVVSVYNEEKALEEFYREITHVLEHISWDHELLFINDGGRDGSQDILDRMAASDSRVRVMSFSRNFRHEAAMIARLNYGRGDGIICMNANLQHPSKCILDILTKFEEGYWAVNVIHTKNGTAGLVKSITSSGFHWLINRILDIHFEANAPDFFAVSHHMAQMLENSYRGEMRFLRGYVQNAGFKKTATEYEAGTRVAGESKYSIKKLLVFSIGTTPCFSNVPLKLGICTDIFSTLPGLAVVICTLCTRKGIPSDYATIMVLVYFMLTIMFVIIGIIDEYIVILSTELKDRPVYIMDRTENIAWEESAG